PAKLAELTPVVSADPHKPFTDPMFDRMNIATEGPKENPQYEGESDEEREAKSHKQLEVHVASSQSTSNKHETPINKLITQNNPVNKPLKSAVRQNTKYAMI